MNECRVEIPVDPERQVCLLLAADVIPQGGKLVVSGKAVWLCSEYEIEVSIRKLRKEQIMISWGEFKKQVEEQGVDDSTLLSWVDFDNCDFVQVHEASDWNGKRTVKIHEHYDKEHQHRLEEIEKM